MPPKSSSKSYQRSQSKRPKQKAEPRSELKRKIQAVPPAQRSTRNTFHATPRTPIEDLTIDSGSRTLDDSNPLPRVPRRPKPGSTPSQRRAAKNLIDALGGSAAVTPRLRVTGNKKAIRLADLMDAEDFDRASFHYKLDQSGLNLKDFTELLLDVNQASAVARLVMSADEVAESIISQATDQYVVHAACLGSGRTLKELEDGSMVPTAEECFVCRDTPGYVLKQAEGESIDRYLELIRLRKNAPMIAMTKNVTNQTLNQYGDLLTGDGAPSIDRIIKAADSPDHRLQPMQLTDGSQTLPVMAGMPEDAVDDRDADVVEAVVVIDGKV